MRNLQEEKARLKRLQSYPRGNKGLDALGPIVATQIRSRAGLANYLKHGSVHMSRIGRMGGKQSAIGRRSKNKGSTFENAISKTVCQYFEVEREECYRTPLSGGHPFGDTGDLVIGTKLFKQFPFVVECKAYQDWKP